jgi:hypothetical protein
MLSTYSFSMARLLSCSMTSLQPASLPLAAPEPGKFLSALAREFPGLAAQRDTGQASTQFMIS